MDPDKIANKLVLVTGASGFIASHCIKSLLLNNCKVIGTVRDLKKREKYENLFNLVPSKKKNLKIVEADLLEKDKWLDITKNCDYVLHIASPVYVKYKKKDKKNLLESGKLGTRNVLEACIANGIKKIVITSSVAAVFYQKTKKLKFTSLDFSDDDTNSLYAKTKLEAEKEIFKIAFKNKGKINMTILNPGIVLGEYLMPNYTASSHHLTRFFKTRFITNIYMFVISIEDVVDAHIKCLKNLDVTNGKRYLLVEESVGFRKISDLLRKEFEPFGYKIGKYEIPWSLIYFMSFFDKFSKWILKNYGRKYEFDSNPIKKDLGLIFRSYKKYMIEAAYSLIDKGFIENKLEKKFEKKEIENISKKEENIEDELKLIKKDVIFMDKEKDFLENSTVESDFQSISKKGKLINKKNF